MRNGGVFIDDEGQGLGGTANLFVPFFTTKPQGSGIGLVLSRQIAEAHGGHALTLENRPDGQCGAAGRPLRLPTSRLRASQSGTMVSRRRDVLLDTRSRGS